MGKSRLEQCQSTKERRYETTLRPLCGNLSELFLFEFTGFLGHVLIQSRAVVDLVSYSICAGFLDFFQVPCASVEHCKTQLSVFAQVDAVGNAWVAGHTYSLLDGNTTTGRKDIFLMKFDAQGVHQWTRQRRGESSDFAHALQADGVRLRFRICSMEENFRSSCEVHVPSQVKWHHSVRINLDAFKKVIPRGPTRGFREFEMFEFDALSLVSLSPSHRLDVVVHVP